MKRRAFICLLFLAVPLCAQFNYQDPAFLANATKRPSGGTPAPTDYLFHHKPEDISGSEGEDVGNIVNPWLDASGNNWPYDSASFPPYITNGVFDGHPAAAFEGGLGNKSAAVIAVTHGIGTGNFTYIIWMFPLDAAGAYKGLACNGVSQSPAIYARLGTPNWGIDWGGDKVSGNTLSQGQWYFLVVRRTGDQVDYWQDGVQTANQYTISSSMANANWILGQDGAGDYNKMLVGEDGLFTRALSDAEIAALFALRTP